jgi:hypothetical protein
VPVVAGQDASVPAVWGANVATADGSDFEGGIGNWSNGTQAVSAAQSTEQAHKGTNSLKIVHSATTTGYLAVTATDFVIAASTAYYFQAWVYTSAAAGVLKIDCDFYQSNNSTYISSIQPLVAGVSLVQNTWNVLGPIAFTSPALAGYIRPVLVVVSGMGSGDVSYLDDLFVGRQLIPSGGMSVQQSVMRASLR